MNFEGWSSPYKVNRPLKDAEKQRRLQPTQRTDADPWSQWTVVQINDVFLEVVDKVYPFRGITLLFGGPLLALSATMTALFAFSFPRKFLELAPDQRLPMSAAVVFAVAMFGFFALLISKILVRNDVFAYTHYPVRLNRKDRMVYVFRSNRAGGVLALKWNDVFWELAECTGRFAGSVDYEIRGHVIDADGVTVRDTFSLGASDDSVEVARQWELFRRYMEGGPGQVPPQQLLPIANRREPFWFGMRRCSANLAIHPVFTLLTSPYWASIGWVRGIAMRTCRVPRWPADVVAACEGQVSPGKEMRKKDRISSTLGDDWTSRIVVLLGSLVGGACGAAFWYWVFTGSGFVRIVGEAISGVR
jgi:hypothetical protein